jgi:hypothetical protein
MALGDTTEKPPVKKIVIQKISSVPKKSSKIQKDVSAANRDIQRIEESSLHDKFPKFKKRR